MEWLNYHHLYYFWMTVREGSITRAAARLRLSQPTISGQIKALEGALGDTLLVREGRGLRPTVTGDLVFRYADEIFGLGRELLDAVHHRGARSGRLVVGIADVLPKILSRRLLTPVLASDATIHLVCREDKHERLLAELAIHTVDLVLSDAPIDRNANVRAYNHLLGECGVSIMASPSLGLRARDFPRCLDDAPFLLPGEGTALRRSLDVWLEGAGLRPQIVAICDDSALLKAFGEAGVGAFAVPSAVATEIGRAYGVRVLGKVDSVRERVYAITTERRIRHPAVATIAAAAKTHVLR
ncbi:MAG: transcriptional activator NhaR [Nannocystaceae bacterium]